MKLTQIENIIGCILMIIGVFVYISMWCLTQFAVIVFVHLFILIIGGAVFYSHLDKKRKSRKYD